MSEVTRRLSTDSTLQSTNTALGLLAKDTTAATLAKDTTLATLAKDTTLWSTNTAIEALTAAVTALPNATQAAADNANAAAASALNAAEQIENKIPVEEVTFGSVSGNILHSDGSVSATTGWTRSEAIDVNGCAYVQISGTFNVLVESSGYTHMLFMSYDYLQSQYLVQAVNLAHDAATTLDGYVVNVPGNAHFMYICDSSSNYSTVEVSKYYKPLTQTAISELKTNLIPYMVPETITQGNLTVAYNGESIVLNGTASAATTIFLYSSAEQKLIKNGGQYMLTFYPEDAENDTYIQIYNDLNTNALVSSQNEYNKVFNVPDDAEDLFVRLVVAAGSYSDKIYRFTLEETEYKELNISTATQLYNFLKNPVPFTKLILESKEYNLYDSLYEDDIDSSKSVDISSYMRDVIIIGNNAVLKFYVPQSVVSSKATVVNTYSVLNFIGNCKVYDLTLDAYNLRYALHLEALSYESAWDVNYIFENCKFIYNQNTTGINRNTIGIGGSKGQRYVFKNCYFENTTYPQTFYIHTRTYNMSEIRIENCIFNNNANGYGMVLSQYTGNGEPVRVNISNSIIGKINMIKQDGGDTNSQYEIVAVNSFISNIEAASGVTVLYTPKRINTITGEIDTTYT